MRIRSTSSLYAIMIVLGLWGCTTRACATDKFMSLTTGDSLRLAACSMQEYVWRGNIDCTYKVLQPKRNIPDATLLLFHGAGDNAPNFVKIAARIDTAFLHHVVIQAPVETTWHVDDSETGEPQTFRGYSWISTRSSSWADGGLSLSLYFVDQVLERVIDMKADRLPPIFVLGFRQGAGVAAVWAAAHRELVDGVVLVSGYADGPIRTLLEGGFGHLKDVPCLALIGTEAEDAISSADLALRVRELGASVQTRFLARGAQFSPKDYPIIREFIRSHMKHKVEE